MYRPGTELRLRPRGGSLPYCVQQKKSTSHHTAWPWLYDPAGNYWHNGATGGYSAYTFFNPKGDYAAVVLVNTTIGQRGSFAGQGCNFAWRLADRTDIYILAPA